MKLAAAAAIVATALLGSCTSITHAFIPNPSVVKRNTNKLFLSYLDSLGGNGEVSSDVPNARSYLDTLGDNGHGGGSSHHRQPGPGMTSYLDSVSSRSHGAATTTNGATYNYAPAPPADTTSYPSSEPYNNNYDAPYNNNNNAYTPPADTMPYGTNGMMNEVVNDMSSTMMMNGEESVVMDDQFSVEYANECVDAIASYLDAVVEHDEFINQVSAASSSGAVADTAPSQPVQPYRLDVFDNIGTDYDAPTPTTTTTTASAAPAPAATTTLPPTTATTPPQIPGLTPEEEQELQDKFLKMVSTEVQVKKLLNQNPYALTDIPLGVMVNRFLDNIEDDAQIKNGKKKGMSKLKRQDKPSEERPTVVVLGTGWAAHAFIKLASTFDLRIVVVSPVNHFVFTPMLASAAVGTVEYRSMTEPIRVTNPYIDNFVEGRAIGVDVENKKVEVQLTSLSTVTGMTRGLAHQAECRLEPEPVPAADNAAGRIIELNYDYLLCSVGTSVRSSIVPGAKEHCFNLKTSQDSKRLRTAIGEALEFASRPDVQESYYTDPYIQELAREERRRRVRFVIVGGGPTGVELAGELSDFILQICKTSDGAYQHLADDISVTLVHGGSDLLPAMDQDLRELALSAMNMQGVEVRLNTRLEEVGRDYVSIREKGSEEVVTVPVGLTVWAAGNAPVPFVQELLSQLPEEAAGPGGRVNVDRWLRCPTPTPDTFGSILVLGDAACIPSQPGEYDAKELPQTAQVAGQQGAFAARMLNRGYDLQRSIPKLRDESEYTDQQTSLLRTWLVARGLEEAPEFTFLSLGLLAYIGGGEALNQVELGPVPIFNYAGKIAFALWRSVYLSKQAATRNQALIAFDWLRTETFGRDITRL